MSRPVTDRMAEAKLKMLAANGSGWKRKPKAFYLNQPDHAEFMATNPPMVDATFRLKPSREYGFDGVPVREAVGLTSPLGVSKIYSAAGTSVSVLPS